MARAAMAAISSLAAEADSMVTVLLFSFCRKQGTKASSTISIWRLETRVSGDGQGDGGDGDVIPPERLGCVGDHGDAQLDGLADGEGQVLVAVAKICKEAQTQARPKR